MSVLLAGGKAGEKQADKRWQAETVERGFAEYNAKTGQWQWKGSEVDGE